MRRTARRQRPEPLLAWLKAMPPTEGKTPHTGTVQITLPFTEWICIREASARHGMTMEEVIEEILRGSDELCEMSVSGQ